MSYLPPDIFGQFLHHLENIREIGIGLPESQRNQLEVDLSSLQALFSAMPVDPQTCLVCEHEFRLISAQIPATFWTVDTNLIFTSSNGSALKSLLLEPGAVVGKSLYEISGASDVDHPTIASHMRALQGEVATYQFTNQGRVWEARVEPLRGANGKIQGVIGISMDITERKQVEDELFRSRQMLELVLNTIPQRVFWKDASLRYLGCNQPFADDAGFKSPEEVIGKTDLDLSPMEEAQSFRADDNAVMEEDRPHLNYEEMLPRPDGNSLWVRTNKVPLHNQSGEVVGVLGSYDDVTERKMAEEELQRANERLILWVDELEVRNRIANLLRQMDDLMQVCDLSEEAYAVIEQFCPQLFPETAGAVYLMGQDRNSLEAVAVWGDVLQSERIFAPIECWSLRRGRVHMVKGSQPGLRCRHVPADFKGDYIGFPMMAAGEVMGLLHIEARPPHEFGEDTQEMIRGVGEHLSLSLSNLKLRETLRSQSVRDPLTGLFNRRYMEESLEREISRAMRKQSCLGLIMIDIDHFKQYNDAHGHDAGDAVLRELGAFLKTHIRTEDIACRYGGEEFILILPDAPLAITRQRAEQIREGIAALTVIYQQRSLGLLTISAGVADFPQHGRNSPELLKSADSALYLAKRNGRNRIEEGT